MKITIKKVLLRDVIFQLFELDNKIYIRHYHRKSKDQKTLLNDYKNSDILMVYDDTVSIGFAAFEEKIDNVEIYAFGFLPEYQNKGIGSLLMKELLNVTKGKTIQLLTHPSNSPAIIFYLKNGFEIIDWKNNYYNNGQPRVMLKKE